ncbi:UNVERIFIED_CONTAM: hypothetical protein K2H54_035047 [Gekko kuhli]
MYLLFIQSIKCNDKKSDAVEGDHETPLTQEAEEGAEDEGNEGDMDDLPPLEGTSASTQIVECQSPPATNPTDAEFPPAVVMGKLSPNPA